jgi:hypothetical protein
MNQELRSVATRKFPADSADRDESRLPLIVVEDVIYSSCIFPDLAVRTSGQVFTAETESEADGLYCGSFWAEPADVLLRSHAGL